MSSVQNGGNAGGVGASSDDGSYLPSVSSADAMTIVAQAFRAVADASTQVMTGAALDQIDRSTMATKIQNLANEVEAIWNAAQSAKDKDGNPVQSADLPAAIIYEMREYGIQINGEDAGQWFIDTTVKNNGPLTLADVKLVQETLQNSSQSYINATTLNSTTLSNTVSNYTNASQAMSDTFKKWTSLNQGILGNIGR